MFFDTKRAEQIPIPRSQEDPTLYQKKNLHLFIASTTVYCMVMAATTTVEETEERGTDGEQKNYRKLV